MKRTLKMKVLSFALAFITAVMLFPYGTLTAYAVNEVTEADENLVNEPLIEENDTATATEPENSTSAPAEEETEIFYDEYEIENTAMSAPPMTQIGGSAGPSDLGPLEPVVLPDGVYEIENVGNDNYYMTVENNYAVAGYRMVQQNYSSNTPLTNFSRSSLFKVSRVGNTNQYVIRSMLNNRMSFNTGTDIDINKFSTGYINTNDSNVNTTYTILQSGGVYTIHPYGSTSVLAAPNTTVSGENDPAAAQLILSTSSAAGNRGKWKFTAYTGNIKYGTERTQTGGLSNGLVKGKTGTVWIKGWSTVIGANTAYMAVDSGYTNIASSTWDAYAGGATITGLKCGDFKLRAEIRSDPSTTATHTNSYTYTVIPDIAGDVAYVQNVGTGRYMEVDSGLLSDGGIVQQNAFGTHAKMQWIFELGGGGYFKIKNVNSGKYLGVDSSDTTKVKQYTTVTDYTLWKLTETSNGRYKISCKASALSGKVLSTSTSTSGNGADLTMLAHVNDLDYRDEWYIFEIGSLMHIAVEGQQESNWCWAASARMFARNHYPGVLYTQSHAVQHVKGSVVNSGGTNAEAAKAMDYYISNISSASFNTSVLNYRIYSEAILKNFLDEGYVIYIARGWYGNINDSTSRNSGHATVICGYIDINGTTRFVILDPLPVNNGSYTLCSYQKIVNGRNCQADEIPDTGVWDGTIVIKTSYHTSTLPYYFN